MSSLLVMVDVVSPSDSHKLSLFQEAMFPTRAYNKLSSAVGIGHFKPVVTNDQTRQLVISKDLIGMRFSYSSIRINFKDEIKTFNPYIMINSSLNYMFTSQVRKLWTS